MIRNAVYGDYKKILDIVREVHRIHRDARPDVYKETSKPLGKERFTILIDDQNSRVFVTEIDGEIAAYCILSIKEIQNHPILNSSKTVYIDDFAVKSVYRGSGYGKSLFDYIKSFAECESANSIQLTVWEFNMSAIRFYNAVGMETRNRKMELLLNK